ncbi:MAG: hypothetical protein ACREOZ_01635, partial [Gloeomargaritales cyanobacterium]
MSAPVTVSCISIRSSPDRPSNDQKIHHGIDDEVSTILTKIAKSHIVNWLSVTPGIPTIQLQLATLPSPFTYDCVILEHETLIAAVTKSLLPRATVVSGEISDIVDPSFPLPSDCIHAVDMTCRATDYTTQLTWLAKAQDAIKHLADIRALRFACLVIPLNNSYDAGVTFTNNLKLPPHWRTRSGSMNSSMYCDCVAAFRWIAVCYYHRDSKTLSVPKFPTPPSDCYGFPLTTCLMPHYNNLLCSVGQIPSRPPSLHPCTHVPHTIARLVCAGGPTTNVHIIVDPTTAAPTPNPTEGPLQYSYGVPFDGPDRLTHIRAVRLTELLHTYSTPDDVINTINAAPTAQIALQKVLHTCSPFKFIAALVEQWMSDFILPTYYEPMDIINSYATCLIARPLPHDNDWNTAYNNDDDTKQIMEKLSKTKPKWGHRELLQVHSAYRQ